MALCEAICSEWPGAAQLVIAFDGVAPPTPQWLAGPNVRILGRVSEAFLWECYRRCRALVFPGIEDFGIVPVECLSAGRPVIGIDAGGLRESVVGFRPWQGSNLVPAEHTGIFVPKDKCGDVTALVEAVRAFGDVEQRFDPATLKSRARQFSYATFFKAWASFLEEVGLRKAPRQSNVERVAASYEV